MVGWKMLGMEAVVRWAKVGGFGAATDNSWHHGTRVAQQLTSFKPTDVLCTSRKCSEC